MAMANSLWSGLKALGRGIRDGWLVLGLTLALFFILEAAARLYVARGSSAERGSPAVAPAPHPYAGQPWWPELQRDLQKRDNRFDPYRSHWAGPVRSRFVNVDSQGYRLTVGPPPGDPGERLVFMLGGSTMWGYTSRDSMTVPSLTAVELAERGVRNVRVINLAQAAYNSTQELNTLAIELARGRVPAAAVFLDGYNDVASAVLQGAPGLTYGQREIEGLLRLGRRSAWEELWGLGRHSMLVDRLRRRLGLAPSAEPTEPASGAVCGPTAAYFRNVAHEARALGRDEGFPVLYFLQPVLVSSKKPASPWERHLGRSVVVQSCLASVDSAMSPDRGTLYFSLGDLFDADSETVFIDSHAHITEAANRRVADRIADVLAPILASEPPRQPPPGPI